jgi:hypothetical protein
LNRLEIGEHTTKPALIDVEHATAFGFFGHGFLGLLLRANEQNGATVGGKLLYKFVSIIEARYRLL